MCTNIRLLLSFCNHSVISRSFLAALPVKGNPSSSFLPRPPSRKLRSPARYLPPLPPWPDYFTGWALHFLPLPLRGKGKEEEEEEEGYRLIF